MSTSPPTHEITRLLHAWRNGDAGAQDELWPLLYDELKALARGVRYRQRAGRLGPHTTTLVHEAYLRLLGAHELPITDRQHFFALAARAMRFVLVDQARRRLADKRDAQKEKDGTVPDVAEPAAPRPEEVLAVHQAMDRLSERHPRYEKLVELRYFAGFSVDETAEVLGVSRPTVVRDWRAVKTWLYGVLQGTTPPLAAGA